MDTFFLCRFSLANQSPGGRLRRPGRGLIKNIQNRNQKHFLRSPVSVVWEITERMLHYPRKPLITLLKQLKILLDWMCSGRVCGQVKKDCQLSLQHTVI